MMKPISVSDKMPEYGKVVFAFCNLNRVWREACYLTTGSGDIWFNGTFEPMGTTDFITHWLPMPPAPDSAAWRECAEGEGE